MPRESAELPWRSKGIGIEGLGSARPMLSERLASQPFERLLGLGEGGLPALVGGKFLKDGRRKFVLFPLGTPSSNAFFSAFVMAGAPASMVPSFVRGIPRRPLASAPNARGERPGRAARAGGPLDRADRQRLSLPHDASSTGSRQRERTGERSRSPTRHVISSFRSASRARPRHECLGFERRFVTTVS